MTFFLSGCVREAVVLFATLQFGRLSVCKDPGLQNQLWGRVDRDVTGTPWGNAMALYYVYIYTRTFAN